MAGEGEIFQGRVRSLEHEVWSTKFGARSLEHEGAKGREGAKREGTKREGAKGREGAKARGREGAKGRRGEGAKGLKIVRPAPFFFELP